MAGFSCGAGPAIVAAAQGAQARLVASFGGYADLRHVIRYTTTGVHGFGQARYVQLQEEYNRWKLLALLAGFVQSPADRRLLEELARRKLNNPGASVGELTAPLGQDGQPVLALALNHDEGAVDQLLAHLPPGALEVIDRLSARTVVPRLSGRLLIVHGAEDRTIPFTQSLRLAEAAGPRARLAILRSFQHAGPDRLWHSLGQRVVDGWRLVGIADDLLDL